MAQRGFLRAGEYPANEGSVRRTAGRNNEYAANSTLVTTGMLPVVVLASAALTAPVSLYLLQRYRRAVLAAMATRAGSGVIAPSSSVSVDSESVPSLRIQVLDQAALDGTEPLAYRQAGRLLFLAASVYIAAGLAYACVMAGAWMVFTREDGFPLTRCCGCFPHGRRYCGEHRCRWSARARLVRTSRCYLRWRQSGGNAELTQGRSSTSAFTTAPPVLRCVLHRRARVGPQYSAFMVTAVTDRRWC
jgi:hypothetical protein